MAQNTIQFSECIERLTAEEFAWWHAVDRAVENEDGADLSALVDESMADDEIGDMLQGLTLLLYETSGTVYLYAEEDADVGVVGMLVCAFLRRFRPGDTFYLTWASACSKPRPGEFGGGMLIADKDGWDSLEVGELHQLTRSQLREITALTRAG